jgi:tetratricopeptide (TPR) repeat protein
LQNKKKLPFFCLIIVFSLSNTLLFAQAGRGRARIHGRVTDESNNPVVSAQVTIKFMENENIIRETKTDKNGKWKIMGLGSGNWRINVEAEGFMPYQDVVDVMQLSLNPTIVVILKKVEEQIAKDVPGIEIFEKANQLFNEEKYEEAIAAYQEFLEKNPEIFQVHFSLGNCYKELGNTEQALQEYQLVLEKTDAEKDLKLRAKTLATIGESYLKKEDLDSAQDYFKKSLDLDPQDEILAYNVGEIYFSHQKLDGAVEYFELASKIKPDWPDAFYKLGLVYLNLTDYEMAKENLKKFLELEADTERSASVQNILNYIENMNQI